MSSLALNRPVKEKNPPNIPVDHTHYWSWLDFTQPDIHSIDTKVEYLNECFGFVKGTHTLGPEVFTYLRYIENEYFNRVLLPKVKERWSKEKSEEEARWKAEGG